MRKCFNAAPVLETLSSWQSEELRVSEPQRGVVWIGKATSLVMDGAWRESMLPRIKLCVCLQDVMREDIYCHCLRRAGCLIMLIAASFAHPPSPFTYVGSLTLTLWYSLLPTEKYLMSDLLFIVLALFSLVTFSCHSISHLLLTFYLSLHCPQLSQSFCFRSLKCTSCCLPCTLSDVQLFNCSTYGVQVRPNFCTGQ